MNDELLTTEKR